MSDFNKEAMKAMTQEEIDLYAEWDPSYLQFPKTAPSSPAKLKGLNGNASRIPKLHSPSTFDEWKAAATASPNAQMENVSSLPAAAGKSGGRMAAGVKDDAFPRSTISRKGGNKVSARVKGTAMPQGSASTGLPANRSYSGGGRRRHGPSIDGPGAGKRSCTCFDGRRGLTEVILAAQKNHRHVAPPRANTTTHNPKTKPSMIPLPSPKRPEPVPDPSITAITRRVEGMDLSEPAPGFNGM